MLRPEDLPAHLKYPLLEIAGSRITAAESDVAGDPLHAIGGTGESCLGVRQQRRENGPGSRVLRVIRDRGLDYSGGRLTPPCGYLLRHLIECDRLHQTVHGH